jgi:RimK family alpha-L-glutamate ligase
LKVAIIGAGNGWHTQQLQAALTARGHACSSLPVAGMVAQIGAQPLLTSAGSPLDSFDLILARIIPRGSLEQTIFRMDSLHLLEKRGVQVVNSAKTIEQTVDKLYTSGLIAQAGLLTPRTIVCERSAQAIEAFAALGGDVVLKPVFGSMGLGMVRIQQEDVAYRVFKALELERAVYYLQEFIPHHGRDLRAFILGGRILAAMERSSDGWRTNFARGARCRAVRLTAEQEAICLQAADIVGAEYAGVDLLPAVSGPDYLLEVNGIPGWKGLQETCELDIPAEIVAYLETRQPR